MLNLEELKLKKLDKKGLNILVDWAATEGWNPGKYDFEVFWETDPDGFCGFYFEGELIAGGAIISYNNEYGFMGLFIVRPDFRGKGIGEKLWYLRRDLLKGRLLEGAVIGMDGVEAMQPFYEKGGFEIAFRDERYACTGKKYNASQYVSLIDSQDFEMVRVYDLKCFGFDRKTFLKHWLKIPNSNSFKFMEGDELRGYALIRKVEDGFKIGPLFADSDKIAEELYKACLNCAEGQSVFLDIPVTNKGAVSLVEKYNAKYVFECARMYHGKGRKPDMHHVYGVTTFELG
ncbi:GNAT family N-acetyltransferase [Cyclobacterium marinum]|uniref:GCN5-related N-acetyltransferase n=1 Tax=Cyclobacterium marinum (strain ATCC 25205 / DSM 745 / LMG 13164 / NCIMB 1802) TaxID=880070 RepID=G0IY35_CYCMS|nr:GNAT family N-acetyltransferase [Cyclobacterium marinum]AEL24939.1 GCN5-related N-acetyltransferase [Cyclobacterium marinum DSM 745]